MSGFGGSRLKALVLFAVGLFVLLGSIPAGARPWKPAPSALAQDYALIQHMRGPGEIVMVFWLAPPMFAEVPAAQQLLDKYVVVAVVHGRQGPGGSMLFDDIDTLAVKDAGGKPLKLLTGKDLPDEASQFVTAMGGSVKQSIGAMGQGMHFFVFEKGGVSACAKGGLSVPLDGETYTYDTPFPGCPKN